MLKRHDVIVIGSSPLLMMAAVAQRKMGKTVLILEESDSLGGAWRVSDHPIDAGHLSHECACHLVEWYRGGYERLQELADYPFLPLEPQPVKIWKNGQVSNYTSRVGILGEYLRSFRASVVLAIKTMLAIFRFGRRPAREYWHSLKTLLRSLAFITKYRLPGLITYESVRGPEGGYEKFIRHLQWQLRSAGVDVVFGRACSINRVEDGREVVCADGERHLAGQILVGESTQLDGAGESVRSQVTTHAYHHVLISLPALSVQIRNSYVHCVDDEIFHRITFVEDCQLTEANLSFFLVQLRKPLDNVASLSRELDRIFDIYRIALGVEGMRIWRTIEDRHVAASSATTWYGNDDAIRVIRTIGDLSRNVLSLDPDLSVPGRRSEGFQ